MKPYLLVQGTTENIGEFEDKVSNAIEEGYEFSGDLLAKKIEGSSNLFLLQPMMLEEDLELDEEELEELQSRLADN